jgi:hypothetical protein
MSATGILSPGSPIEQSRAAAPQLFVVVDTEEEFDWSAPFARTNTSVRAMRQVHRGQRLFDEYGLRPMYVVDYAVAANPEGYQPLLEIVRDARCEVGAHLHPWINPPHDEPVNRANSFTCNLPVALQRAKLAVLCDTIAGSFGRRPVTFKAGRYGLTDATAMLLEEAGFEIDNSVCPRFDFSSEGGPSFRRFDAQPFLLPPSRRVLEVPCTVEYVGRLPLTVAERLHRWASHSALQRLGAHGVLSRLQLVNRIMLSPEGNSFDEMRILVRTLVSRGIRTFTMSFHSPSLEPGHTPYVRTEADLGRFLDRIKRFCDFFFGDLSGAASTVSRFRASVVPTAECSS